MQQSPDRRKAGSSSTMWTTRSSGIVFLVPRFSGEGEAENCSADWVRFGPKLAAMRFDDSAADREAEPHAAALGRNEWLEQVLRDFRRQARAAISHRDLDGLLVAACRRNNEL